MIKKLVAKISIFCLLAVVISYLSNQLSEPPPSKATLKYQQYFNEESKKMKSEKEFEEFNRRAKEMLADMSSPERTEAIFNYMVKRKAAIVPVALLVWFGLGSKFGFRHTSYLIGMSIAVGLLSKISVNLVEAIAYAAAFLIGNIILLKKRPVQHDNLQSS